jgi:type IV secretory pathway VirB2 component (pilin)
MKKQIASILGLALFLGLFAFPIVSALDFNQTISPQDKQTFDQILQPVMKIYNFVKYSASVLAIVVLLFAGITYITSGSNPGKREQAKSMAMYVIIGLVVIWAAPMVVNFIIG